MANNPYEALDSFEIPGSDDYSALDSFDLSAVSKAKAKETPNKNILTDTVHDIGIGTMKLPGMVTGLADIPAGLVGLNRPFSRAADAVGEATGFQPGKWADDAQNKVYSQERQQSNQAVQQAWDGYEKGDKSFVEAAGETIANPRALAGSVAQSLPSMVVGGLGGRALLGAASKLAPAVGEGAVMAGQQMDNIDDAVDPQKAAAASVITGLAGGAMGYAGGRIAEGMGVVDPDTVFAQGLAKGLSRAEAAQAANAVQPSLMKRVGLGAVQEGLTEELPQSLLEQGAQNIAEDKPFAEGMAQAGVEGALSGGLMGAGFNALPRSEIKPDDKTNSTTDNLQPAGSVDPATEQTVNTPAITPSPTVVVEKPISDGVLGKAAAAGGITKTEVINVESGKQETSIPGQDAGVITSDAVSDANGYGAGDVNLPGATGPTEPLGNAVSQVSVDAQPAPNLLQPTHELEDGTPVHLVNDENWGPYFKSLDGWQEFEYTPKATPIKQEAVNDLANNQTSESTTEESSRTPVDNRVTGEGEGQVAAGYVSPDATTMGNNQAIGRQGAANNQSETDVTQGVNNANDSDGSSVANNPQPAIEDSGAGSDQRGLDARIEPTDRTVDDRGTGGNGGRLRGDELPGNVESGGTLNAESSDQGANAVRGVSADNGGAGQTAADVSQDRLSVAGGVEGNTDSTAVQNEAAPPVNRQYLIDKGVTETKINLIERDALKQTNPEGYVRSLLGKKASKDIDFNQLFNRNANVQSQDTTTQAPATQETISPIDKFANDLLEAYKTGSSEDVNNLANKITSDNGLKNFESAALIDKFRRLRKAYDEENNTPETQSVLPNAGTDQTGDAAPTNTGSQRSKVSAPNEDEVSQLDDLKQMRIDLINKINDQGMVSNDRDIEKLRNVESAIAEAEKNTSQTKPAVIDAPIIEHDGEQWYLQNKGVDKDGKTFAHLSSVNKGRAAKNGVQPVQMNDWVDNDVIAKAEESYANSKKQDALPSTDDKKQEETFVQIAKRAGLEAANSIHSWKEKQSGIAKVKVAILNSLWVNAPEKYTENDINAIAGNVYKLVENEATNNKTDSLPRSTPEAHARLMQINPVGDSTTEFVVGEPRPGGGLQNYARFSLNDKGNPVKIKYFYSQPIIGDAVKIAISSWKDSRNEKTIDANPTNQSKESTGPGTKIQNVAANPKDQMAPNDLASKEPAPQQAESEDYKKAKSDLDAALGDLGQFFLENNLFTKKAVPGEFDDAKLMPIMARVMDAAIRMGYAKFKDAAKFTLDTVREKFGDRAADSLTLDHLQGGYIAVAGKHKALGTDSKRDVIDVESLDEINAASEQQSTTNETGDQNENTQERQGLVEVQGMDNNGAEEVSGGRDRELADRGGNTNSEGNAGVLEAEQTANVQNAGGRRNTRKNSPRSGVQDVGARGKESEVGDSVAGQSEPSGTGLADDGAGKVGRTGQYGDGPLVKVRAVGYSGQRGTKQPKRYYKYGLSLATGSTVYGPESEPINQLSVRVEFDTQQQALDWAVENGYSVNESSWIEDKVTEGTDSKETKKTKPKAAKEKKAKETKEDQGRVDGGSKTSLGNYHIDDPEMLIGGTPKVRFARNKKAIETYNSIIEDGREPTKEERDAMASYIGWGSFGQELFQGSWEKPVFRDGWNDENQWLRDHLGEKAWKSAQASIINAHYTDPPTVSSLWKIAEHLGFKKGRVLEPSMGIGNFFGLMPLGMMEQSNLTGIELDDTTGGMAKMLYPDANVQIKGYQDSKTADDFYDLVIGNWPFAKDGPSDRRYNKLNLSLHDYFFVKALDQARPGGFVIGITSSGTMDKIGRIARYEMSKKANLVAAFRMPMGAFDKYAGTNVVADIIILQKHGNGVVPADADWLDVEPLKNAAGQELTRRDGSVVKVNQYWAKHPENVLGRMTVGHGTTQGRDGMIVERQDGYADVLANLADRLPKDIMTAHDFGKAISYISNNTNDRQNSITTSDDGNLYVVQGDRLALLSDVANYAVKSKSETEKREDQIKRLVGLRKAYGNLIDAEIRGAENVESLRKTLNDLYQGFKKEHGTISTSNAIKLFKKVKDPFYPVLSALEVNTGTQDKPVYSPAAILTRPTTRSKKSIDKPSIADAFVLERNKNAQFIDIESIAELANTTVSEVEKELVGSGALFKTPSGNYEVRDIYLSGNVRRKLREALDAQEAGQDMSKNIDALKGVVPKDIPYFAIEASMGATWVPARYYKQFIAELVGVTSEDMNDISVVQTPKSWRVGLEGWINQKPEARTIWGVPFYPFSKLVNAAFNGQAITIRVKDEDGNLVTNEEYSKKANEKAEKIREEFKQWVWKDAERRIDLEKSYNEILNAYASPDFDGSFLSFDGLALQRGDAPFNLRKHQVNAIWRGIANGRGMYAHEVGTGKTYTMGGIAVESRRYGIAKKPMIIAHNANSASVASDIQSMYPASKVLYIDNLSPATIDQSMYQIANDDWDAVVIPHSLIDRMVLSEKTLMDIAARDIMALEEEAIASAAEDGFDIANILDDQEALRKVHGAATAKELVKQRNAIITNIKKQAERASKENAITFENLGVDMLIVDESHEFKKPPLSTRRRVKGLNVSPSGEGIAMNFLTTYVRNVNNGKGIHVFTGTPITNTLNEIYNQMRYVMGDAMDDAGVYEWDAWFNSFADIVSDVELTATGEYESVSRLAGFQNVPELRRFAGQYMDIVFADEMPEFVSRTTASGKTLHDNNLTDSEREELINGRSENPIGRPYKKVINDTAEMSPVQRTMLTDLMGLARMFKKASKKMRRKLRDHKSNPVLVETAAAQAGFDPRLIDMSLDDHENYKTNRVVKRVLEHYQEDPRATQVIFMEKGYNDQAERSMYDPGGFRRKDAEGKSIKETVPTFNVAKDLVNKLVSQGIPKDEIAVVTGSTSKEKRKEIADKMNQSKIRVVIGSTATLGVGVNMQENLRAMHHLDAPWMPGELEQRNGRGHRQGNKWNTVYEYRYLTEGIDGRRWQVLAVKQKFINAFLKADESTRVIEGDAVDVSEGDNIDDISESLSAAAGDPRLLVREKLKNDVNKLENKQRNHDYGIADAKATASRLREANAVLEKSIADAADDAEQVAAAKEKGFSITIEGNVYDKRDEANAALTKYVGEQTWQSFRNVKQKIGSINGFDIVLQTDWNDKFEVVLSRTGQHIASPTIASIEANLRGIAKSVEKRREKLNENIQSIARMEDAAKTPFSQAKQLEKKKQLLEQLEKDIEMYPVAAPAWLRDGAPIGTDVYINGEKKSVTGHRWGNDNWFVQVDDGEGNIAPIPYTDVMDENNTPVYDKRDFIAPEVLENSQGAATGANANAPTTTAQSSPNGVAIGSTVVGPERQSAEVLRVIEPTGDIKTRLRDWQYEVRLENGDVEIVGAEDFLPAAKPSAPGVKYSKQSSAKSGSTVDQIKSLLPKRVRKMLDDGTLKVVQSAQKAINAGALSFDAGKGVEGFYNPDTDELYIIADNVNQDTLQSVLAHELLHRGLATDSKWKRAYDRFISNMQSRFDDAASGFGTQADKEAYRRVMDAKTPEKDRIEEFAAYMVSAWQQSPKTVSEVVKKVIQDFIAAIRAFLIRNGFDLGFIKSLTPADLAAMSRYGAKVGGSKMEQATNSVAGIRYSIASKPGDATKGDSNLQSKLTQAIADRMNSDKTFNWWHKTVGTQFHKALIDKHFGKVFDKSMAFEQDTARFANEAADLAPSLFPDLDDARAAVREVVQGYKRNRDAMKVGDAIFQTTLNDRRMTARDLEKQGYSPVQIKMYQEFFAAVNKSLDDLAKSEMYRAARLLKLEPAPENLNVTDTGKFYYDQVTGPVQGQIDEVSSLWREKQAAIRKFKASGRTLKGIKQYIDEDAKEMAAKARAEFNEKLKPLLAELKTYKEERKSFIDKAAKIEKLKQQGYAPLMRFGEYTVDVVDQDNIMGEDERVFFGMFETQAEANKMARVLQEEYPHAIVTKGVMSQNDWQMFRGLTPETMETMAKLMGGSQEQAFQDYLKLAVNNRSAMKRLIRRKKIAGFESDPQRVLATFITSNARAASKNFHLGDMMDAITSIPKTKGDVIDEAVDLYNYVQNPAAAGAKIRNILFAWYLGGSIASAAVNMTQTLTTTFPYLHQFGSTKQVGAEIAKAMKMAAMPKSIGGDLGLALKRAEEEGVTAPHELHMLYGESMRTGLMAPQWLRPLSKAWGSLFSITEAYNRRVAFIAAYNVAKANGKSDPFAEAVKAVDNTQFVYSKSARPNWARSTVGSTLFTFKTFTINYLEFLKRLPKQERLMALGVLVMLAGAGGLPGEDDAEDVIDTLGQMMGYNTNSKAWKERVLSDMLGKEAANVVLRGASSVLPFDISSRLGVSNIVPGSAIFKKSETDKTRDVMEFAGAAGSLASRVVEAFDAGQSREGVAAMAGSMAKSIMPKALQDMAQALDMMQTGQYRDMRGRKVADTTSMDALYKAMGVQPNSVAAPRRQERLLNQDIQLVKAVESDIANLWADGVYEKNRDKVEEAKSLLKKWNERNPETPIRIDMKQIVKRIRQMKMSSEDRLIKTAPKEMRAYAAGALNG